MEATATQDTKTRIDVYALITNKVIEQLKTGTVPWRKPWAEGGIPANLISKKPYRGINLMLLASEGYEHNLFLTFDQVNAIGGKVTRGVKGHMVVYWHKPKEQETETAPPEGESAKKKGFLKYYTVFNISQCENIPVRFLPAERDAKDLPTCEGIVKSMPNCPKIQYKEQKAYYEVVQDLVNMPKKKNFKTDAGYYSTLFHELVHSTGHDSRLARKGVVEMSEFGDEMYSKEELVAEMGTCYLMSLTDITSEFMNSAAYIQGWLSKLKNDRRLIFIAAKEAQKAVDYILNLRIGEEEPAE